MPVRAVLEGSVVAIFDILPSVTIYDQLRAASKEEIELTESNVLFERLRRHFNSGLQGEFANAEILQHAYFGRPLEVHLLLCVRELSLFLI